MTLQAVKVEIAFVSNVYGTPTWTDVTADVESVNTSSASRNYELDRYDGGSAQVVLRNFTGQYDPLNTSSSHYPYVLPFRPVRITSTLAGTTYSLFTGYVTSWPQTWGEVGGQGKVSLTCVDAFAAVLAYLFPQSWADQLAGAAVWWRFNAASESSLGGFTDTGTATNTTGTVESGVIPGDSSSAVKYSYPTTNAATGQTAILGAHASSGSGSNTVTPWVVDGWVQIDSATVFTALTYTLTTQAPSTTQSLPVRLRLFANYGSSQQANLVRKGDIVATVTSLSPQTLTLGICTTGTAATTPEVVTSFGVTLPIGAWTYLAVSMDTSGNTTLWVNGVQAATLTGLDPTIRCPGHDVGVIGWTAGGNTVPWSNLTVHFDEVSQNGTIISPSLRYNLGQHQASFLQEDTGARVGHVLDGLGWPAAARRIDTGLSTVAALADVAGTSAIDLLQGAADAELGVLYVDAAGNVVFRNRTSRNSATSVATFGDGTGEIPVESDLTVSFDPTYVYNQVTVTQTDMGGTAYVAFAQDTTSQATYGVRSLSRSEPLVNTADLDGQAATLLARYKTPMPRVSTATINVRVSAAGNRLTQALTRQIGDLVTVKRRPPGAAVITLACFIEGIRHTITGDSWLTTFTLTPQWPNPTY